MPSGAKKAHSAQMYYTVVMTTAGAALDKCHNAGVNEGFEAWRQFVMEWEPKLRTRYVGLPMNVLGYRFRHDIPTKLAAFERTVHDYENQSTKTVDDDIKIGVTMLEMEDMRVKEHLIRNSVRITSWNQMRKEILEITRTQQYMDSQPMPMQLGANPKSKGKGKESKGIDKAKDVKNESSKKTKSGDQRQCFYCNNRSREGRVQKETERPCRGRRETGGSVATSTRHSSDRAFTVLTPRRELFLLSVPVFLFHLELFLELHYTKDMANLRCSAAEESEDTLNSFTSPTGYEPSELIWCRITVQYSVNSQQQFTVTDGEV